MTDAFAVPAAYGPDSAYAWRRLAVSLVMATVGGIGLWSSVVVLPAVEAEFGVDRGGASLPYTATMIGFAIGGVAMGRLADRFGIVLPLLHRRVMLGLGYVAASQSTSYWQFVAIQALLIGMLGSSAAFGPLVADVSHWFVRRRGIAVAIVASGNYLAGAIWPPLLHLGHRQRRLAAGAFLARHPLRRGDAAAGAAARRRAPVEGTGTTASAAAAPHGAAASRRRRSAGAAGAGRHRLLRRHVDAAGAHGRLLRRPRLRRRRAAPRCCRSCWAWAWSAGSPRASSPTGSAASAR